MNRPWRVNHAWLCLLLVLPLLAAGRPGAASSEGCGHGVLCAGAASVDMTWHTGSGQGQLGTTGSGHTHDKFDPFHHQTKQVPTDGMQSRLYAKAIVVQGPDGTKAAYAKTETYLQQDVLSRRVGQLVSGADPVVTDHAVPDLEPGNVMLGGTHNHSAPQYASTAWGVWLFTDTFDFRMFEATARRIAQAIKEADDALVPARVGASVSRFDAVQQNIIGPTTADDGSPAGFSRDHFDDELAVVRFDVADGSRPIAALVNLGMHPESMATIDLVSGDFVGMTERMVERAMGREPGAPDGPVVAWSQGAVGDIEPDRDGRAHPDHERKEFWRRDVSQAELMSREVAQAVLATWRDVADGTPALPERYVAPTTEAPVGMLEHRFAAPVSHPLPTVSNCRTDHPGLPVVGLPDCERGDFQPPEQYGTTLEGLRQAGIPVPSNYSVPSYMGVQESTTIHLQVLRIGDILLATCPCEPITDMVLNLKSRTDEATGNLYHGFEWPCREGEDDVECNFQRAAHEPEDWRTVDRRAHEVMVAQVRNDASGWEGDLASLQGEAEAHDPDEIYGNFSHTEVQDLDCDGSPCDGYRLPLMVGQANDYIGYVVTYREYQRGDHYRKALTPFGPHTADYLNTRLVAMAAELRGGPPVTDTTTGAPTGAADELIQQAKVMALGAGATAGLAAYEASIPDDGGAPGRVLAASERVHRFDAATMTWEGGSNWTDNPVVRVEHLGDDGSWRTVATQEGGEIVLTLAYQSTLSTAPLDWLVGGKTYEWTATFEAFEETEPGTYRFVVEGHHRSGRQPVPYRIDGEPFEVAAWEGLVAHDLVVDLDARTARFRVGGVELTETELEGEVGAALDPDEVHYPDSYDSELDYIERSYTERGGFLYCWRCTFRPWANTGRVVRAEVTVRGDRGPERRVEAELVGDEWLARLPGLRRGDVVVVERGGVVDEHGNLNGEASEAVGPIERSGGPRGG